MAIEKLYGISIPQSLRDQEERALAYAAGFALARNDGKMGKVISELKPTCEKYAPEPKKALHRADLKFPEITREESSFWAGYITATASLRDKIRSGSKTRDETDLAEGMSTQRGNRNLARELADLVHESEE